MTEIIRSALAQGFHVTFEAAAIRAAQIGFDLNVPGATAFFSNALLNDMAGLIRRDEAPASRQRITPDLHDGTSFWRLRR